MFLDRSATFTLFSVILRFLVHEKWGVPDFRKDSSNVGTPASCSAKINLIIFSKVPSSKITLWKEIDKTFSIEKTESYY